MTPAVMVKPDAGVVGAVLRTKWVPSVTDATVVP